MSRPTVQEQTQLRNLPPPKADLPGAIEKVYEAAPTAEQFHCSDASFRFLVGPIACGKTTTCVAEIIRRCMEQEKGPDGYRRSRWGVVRNSYPELKSTTIREWLEWVPAGVWGDLRQDIPIVFFFNHLDIKAEIIFVSLDKPEHIKKLLSLQLTAAWFNEVREIPIEIVHAMDGRVDRFPPMRDGGPTWGGIIGDTNPPDTEHWLPKLERQIETIRQGNAAAALPEGMTEAEEDQDDADIRKIDPVDYLILHNPDALSPEAENLANLKGGRKWYERKARGKTQAWIDVYVHGKYGSPEEGRPVYPEFKATTVLGGVTVPWHVANGPLKPNRHLPLYLCWDYGITPVCIIFQLLPTGQLAVLEEIIATKINPRGMGIKTLGTYVKKWILGPKYPDYKIISVGDPAGADPSQTDEKSCQDMLRAVGIPTRAASTNLFTPRRQAVVDFLEGPAQGMPGMLIDPRCGTLIEGFKGGYKYKRIAKPGEQRYAYEADKNEFCVDLETEALTPDGWKRHDQLNSGDAIMVMDDPEENDDPLLRIGTVTAINTFPGPRNAIRLFNSQSDFVFTGNHKQIVKTRAGNWRITTTDQLCGGLYLLHPPHEERARKDARLSDRFVRIAAWVAAEGSYRQNDQAILLAQSKMANPEYTRFLSALLAGDPCIVEHNTDHPMQTWRITKELAWLLRYHMPDKVPSPQFIMSMNNRQRRLFIYEFLRGDGNCSNGIEDTLFPDKQYITRTADFFVTGQSHRFFQASTGRTDAIQMMGALCGLPVSVRPGKNGWMGTVRRLQHLQVDELKREEIVTDGVWCPTTNTGNWVMRRGGRVLITGNSHPHDALQYGCLFVNRRPKSGLNRPIAKPYQAADPAVGY